MDDDRPLFSPEFSAADLSLTASDDEALRAEESTSNAEVEKNFASVEGRVLRQISSLAEHYVRGTGFEDFFLLVMVRLGPSAQTGIAFSNLSSARVRQIQQIINDNSEGVLALLRAVRPTTSAEMRLECMRSAEGMNLASLFEEKEGIVVPRWEADGSYAFLIASRRTQAELQDPASETLLADAMLFMSQIVASTTAALRNTGQAKQGALLTERQTDVLRALSEGKPIKQIAEQLHLKPSTIRYLLERCIAKLQVTTREQAVTKATSLGLFRPR